MTQPDATPSPTGPAPGPPLDIPPVYFLGAILLMLLLHHLAPIVDLLDRPWSRLGLIPIVAGVGLAVWAERLFKRAGTGVRPFSPSTALVASGPYRFTRNPMYLGMLLALLGLAILQGSIGGALPVPVFFWLLRERFVRREEAHMERHFGVEYRAFKQRVRRWI
jgi:protein-S-isoprenylcysteine O-methyltransferase Ste14